MDLHLKGKTAVVTGASRGIGLATVSTLLDEGVRVVAASRTITPELKETGAIAVTVDLSTPEGPAHLIDSALAELGELDILVNNVGGGESDGKASNGFLDWTDEQWQEIFELNFFAAVRTTRAALPALVRRRGAIVNVSSDAARTPKTSPIAYASAKGALNVFGKALAETFGAQGVRVNTISPGSTRTHLWEGPKSFGADMAASLGMDHMAFLDAVPGEVGMITGRLIMPVEIATAIAYLASPLAESIIGANYVIDGGAAKTGV